MLRSLQSASFLPVQVPGTMDEAWMELMLLGFDGDWDVSCFAIYRWGTLEWVAWLRLSPYDYGKDALCEKDTRSLMDKITLLDWAQIRLEWLKRIVLDLGCRASWRAATHGAKQLFWTPACHWSSNLGSPMGDLSMMPNILMAFPLPLTSPWRAARLLWRWTVGRYNFTPCCCRAPGDSQGQQNLFRQWFRRDPTCVEWGHQQRHGSLACHHGTMFCSNNRKRGSNIPWECPYPELSSVFLVIWCRCLDGCKDLRVLLC